MMMMREYVMKLANVIPGLGVLYFRSHHLSIDAGSMGETFGTTVPVWARTFGAG